MRQFFYILQFFCFVLVSGLKESLNGVRQTDEGLISVIKDQMVDQPSKGEYNFKKPPILSGQFGQATEVEKLFKGKKNGFFIEAGAYDGEELSNTLLFEMKYNWTGLLIEANPDLYEELLTKNRNAAGIQTCLSTKKEVETVQFDASGPYGGIMNGENLKPGEAASREIALKNAKNPGKKHSQYFRRTLQMQCLPLTSIILALGNPTIDYFSLDIEGAEFLVLKSIDFQVVDIRVISVEVTKIDNIFDGKLTQLKYLMKRNGYELYKEVGEDYIYVKTKNKDEL